MSKRRLARGEKVALIILTLILTPLLMRTDWATDHLLPVSIFFQPTERRYSKSCQTNLKLIAFALQVYAQDFDEKFPPAIIGGVRGGNIEAGISYRENQNSSSTIDHASHWSGLAVGWADVVTPYTRDNSLFQCVSTSQGRFDPTQDGYTDYWFNGNLSAVYWWAMAAMM
jgi:hypothetical protein